MQNLFYRFSEEVKNPIPLNFVTERVTVQVIIRQIPRADFKDICLGEELKEIYFVQPR